MLDWEIVPLGSIARCQGGSAFSPTLQGRQGGAIPFYKVSDMNLPANRWFMTDAKNYVDVMDATHISGSSKPAGSVVFPKVGGAIHTEKKRLLARDSYIDNNMMAVWSTDPSRCTPEFLYAYFLWKRLSELSNPGPLPSINSTRVLELAMPLPPVDDQRRITQALAKVQRALELEERLLSTTRELKRTAMHEVFTRGLHGQPQKASVIGAVPDSWDIVPLGALGAIGNGSTPKRTNPRYWVGGTLPWLTSGKIHERVISKADEFVTPQAAEECHLPNVPAGSLLVAITGQGKTLGNVAITKISTFVSQHLAYVAINRGDVDGTFMRHYLSSRYEYLRGLGQAGGSTKGAITCGGLKMVPVPLPPLDEQREISHVLNLIDQKADTHERKRVVLQELFDILLDGLMTGRLRVGHLDVGDDVAA